MSKAKLRSPLYEEALAKTQSLNCDLDDVLNLLNRAINEGDERASYALGTWYLHGKHVQEDKTKGFYLIEMAALAGNSDALYDLAVFYEEGELVAEDFLKALHLYTDAAIRGDAQAHYEVGRFYWHGLVGVADEGLGDVWLRRAEELGITESTTH